MMLVGIPSMANVGNVEESVAPIAPDAVTGLKLWLKADALGLSDGAAVSTWTDYSGIGNDMTQATGGSQPIYKTGIVNGKAVVRFDGSNDYVARPFDANFTNFTVFVVYKTTGDNILVGCLSGTLHQMFRIGESAANAYSFYDGTAVTSSTLSASRSAWNFGCITRSGSAISFYEAGVARGTGTGSGTTLNVGTVGGLISISYGYPSGDVAEVVIYDNVISTGDRRGVESHLSSKYAI